MSITKIKSEKNTYQRRVKDAYKTNSQDGSPQWQTGHLNKNIYAMYIHVHVHCISILILWIFIGNVPFPKIFIFTIQRIYIVSLSIINCNTTITCICFNAIHSYFLLHTDRCDTVFQYTRNTFSEANSCTLQFTAGVHNLQILIYFVHLQRKHQINNNKKCFALKK
jgi:hypothetical protein